jgi:hypothetical protein
MPCVREGERKEPQTSKQTNKCTGAESKRTRGVEVEEVECHRRRRKHRGGVVGGDANTDGGAQIGGGVAQMKRITQAEQRREDPLQPAAHKRALAEAPERRGARREPNGTARTQTKE